MINTRRILRRAARRLMNRVKLAVVNHQLAIVEQNIAHYQGTLIEAQLLKQDEAVRLNQLAVRRQALKAGVA